MDDLPDDTPDLDDRTADDPAADGRSVDDLATDDLAVDDRAVDDRAADDPAGDAFDEALEAAIARLPDAYRAQLATVAIVVADEATREELALVGAPGLYGLYRGVPRTAFGADNVPIPSVITLYRGPLERRWRGPAALVHGVEETLRHELAHHLGISDARLDELHDGG